MKFHALLCLVFLSACHKGPQIDRTLRQIEHRIILGSFFWTFSFESGVIFL